MYIYYGNQDDWKVARMTVLYTSSDGKNIYAEMESGKSWKIYDVTI